MTMSTCSVSNEELLRQIEEAADILERSRVSSSELRVYLSPAMVERARLEGLVAKSSDGTDYILGVKLITENPYISEERQWTTN